MGTSVQIHPTAIVEKGAQLDTGVQVGPYAVIGKDVKIGKNSYVHAHALVTGHTTLGEENQVFSFASVGNPPQDLKYKGEPTTLEIGHKNLIREYVTLQPGTVQGGGFTRIGSENLFMAYSHVAHDCIVGNQNVLANGVQLAGHVTIENMVTLGGLTAVHQFVCIGDIAMTGGGSMVSLDIPPYCLAEGNRAGLRGLNAIGMQRRQISSQARQAVKQLYKILFLENHSTVDSALACVSEDLLVYPEAKKFFEFVKNSKRGVVRLQNRSNSLSND